MSKREVTDFPSWIREMASHDRLMADRGFYYDLYMEQFRPELAGAFTASTR